VRKILREASMVRHFINHKGQAICAHFRLHQFSPFISPRSPTCNASASLVFRRILAGQLLFSVHDLSSLFHEATHPEFFHSFATQGV
jgi:hypothetical protein